MTSARTAVRAAGALGLGPILQFAKYQLALQSGWVRWRTPQWPWGDIEVVPDPERVRRKPPHFQFNPRDDFELAKPAWWDESRRQALKAGESVLDGRFMLFGAIEVDLGRTPDWARFAPLAGGQDAGSVALDRHWTAYDLDNLGADVRLLWEPSRFRWLYTLGRAYRWSGERRFADGAWALIDSWRTANPPNSGPHWISAQEVAFRIMALSFAHSTMADAFDEEQRATIERMVAAHGRRIPPTLAYSRAQGNNHVLSEAAGLYTAGAVFPSLPSAARWRRLGRRLLIRGFEHQVFEDGGYVQHSTNYARLALDLGLWVVQLAAERGEPLPGSTLDRLRFMAALLGRLADPDNGKVPNFGPNDGSQLLPLSAGGFDDFRPTLQAASAVLGRLPALQAGPWDELALWLGAAPEAAGAQIDRVSYPQAGLHLLEGRGGHGVLRAIDFRSRPGHSDQLHLDLWAGGRNRALDAGTYLYNGDPPWRNTLASARVHNTLVVDGGEPMTRAGRFLWLDWSQAAVERRAVSEDGELEAVVAVHDASWPTGVRHRRWVLRIGGQIWLVIDDAIGRGRHRLTVPWLLPDGAWSAEDGELRVEWSEGRVRIQVAGQGMKSALFRAGERIWGSETIKPAAQWGWHSKTYADLAPALHWVADMQAALPQRLQTCWAFDGADIDEVELGWGEEREGLPALASLRWQESQLNL
ncbi:MAG: alginate lyase family protein [Anaerolineales bacterium]